MAYCSVALQIENAGRTYDTLICIILCENCFATACTQHLRTLYPLCFQEDRYWITESRFAALTQTLKLDCRLVSFRTGSEVFKRLLASFLTRVKYLVLRRATAVPNLTDARWHPSDTGLYVTIFSYLILWTLVASIYYGPTWKQNTSGTYILWTHLKKNTVLNRELPWVALRTLHRLGPFDPLDPLGVHVVFHKSCFGSLG